MQLHLLWLLGSRKMQHLLDLQKTSHRWPLAKVINKNGYSQLLVFRFFSIATICHNMPSYYVSFPASNLSNLDKLAGVRPGC
jgi:hypothetical protein